MPALIRFARTSGGSSASLASRWSVATTSAGMPAGPKKSVMRERGQPRQAALDHGGNIGKLGAALGARHRERLDLSCADQRQERRLGTKIHVDAAAQHVGDGLRAAAVGGAEDVGSRGELERLAGQMGQWPLAQPQI